MHGLAKAGADRQAIRGGDIALARSRPAVPSSAMRSGTATAYALDPASRQFDVQPLTEASYAPERWRKRSSTRSFMATDMDGVDRRLVAAATIPRTLEIMRRHRQRLFPIATGQSAHVDARADPACRSATCSWRSAGTRPADATSPHSAPVTAFAGCSGTRCSRVRHRLVAVVLCAALGSRQIYDAGISLRPSPQSRDGHRSRLAAALRGARSSARRPARGLAAPAPRRDHCRHAAGNGGDSRAELRGRPRCARSRAFPRADRAANVTVIATSAPLLPQQLPPPVRPLDDSGLTFAIALGNRVTRQPGRARRRSRRCRRRASLSSPPPHRSC